MTDTSVARRSPTRSVVGEAPEPDPRSGSYAGLLHAGAATGLVVVQLSAVIPGFLAALVLTGVLMAAVLLPMLALSIALAIVLAPPLCVWWTVRRMRQGRRAVAAAAVHATADRARAADPSSSPA
jgi:hypothetical protein